MTQFDLRGRIDRIDIAALRRAGGFKWSLYPEAIGAFVAEMDFGTAPVVTSALHAAVDSAAFGYLPEALTAAMSRSCADWIRDRYGWAVDPADVRPVGDVMSALRTAIDDFSPAGSAVILPTPAYMPFVNAPAEHGREAIQVPMGTAADGRSVYDLDAIAAAFEAGGHLLVLCNPHNPVGRVLEPAEMLAIAEVVDRYGGRVFADEIHAPLVHPGHRHVPYASLGRTARHTLTATSASKAFNLPGLKCAQVILSNDADRASWRRIARRAEHGTSILGVVASTAAFTDGGGWLDEVLDYLDGNRRLLTEAVRSLPGVQYTPPEGTYLAWLDFTAAGLPAPPAAYFLAEAGVAMTEGTHCGRAGAGFARLNFAMPRSVLAQALEQIADAMP